MVKQLFLSLKIRGENPMFYSYDYPYSRWGRRYPQFFYDGYGYGGYGGLYAIGSQLSSVDQSMINSGSMVGVNQISTINQSRSWGGRKIIIKNP